WLNSVTYRYETPGPPSGVGYNYPVPDAAGRKAQGQTLTTSQYDQDEWDLGSVEHFEGNAHEDRGDSGERPPPRTRGGLGRPQRPVAARDPLPRGGRVDRTGGRRFPPGS